MKLVALNTARVIDGIGQLPGVATQDWADRAAAALARMGDAYAAGVMIGTLDSRGFITEVELTGAGLSRTPPDTGSNQARPPVSGEAMTPDRRPDISRPVRNGYSVGDWIGWTLTPPTPGILPISSAHQLGMLQRRGESVIWQRWSALDPTEVIAGVAPIPGAPAGRVVFAEVAWQRGTRSDSNAEQAVLSAALPFLATKVARSFGTSPLAPNGYLTPREELVLWHLLAGEKVPVIAETLGRSVYTVHDHVKSLHRKLNASNRGQLVSRALGHIGPISKDGPDAPAQESADQPADASKPARAPRS